ncbi:MAG: hypothetical protein VKL60_18085 [Sphaerospermopsis sp.]|nr:hypothetical protein [Sphaerospermopsis sp.]
MGFNVAQAVQNSTRTVVGTITVASDFPTLQAVVTSGSQYQVLASVTDNDSTRTNTGQSFSSGDYIVWNGTQWNNISGVNISTLVSPIFTGSTAIQVATAANTGTAYTMDANNGAFFDLTLDNNCTITVTESISAGQVQYFTAKITQDATGGRTLAWSGVTWVSGTAPTMPTTPGSFIVVSFASLNGIILGSVGLQSTDSISLGGLSITNSAGTVLETLTQSSGASKTSLINTVNTTDATVTTLHTITLATDTTYDIWGKVRARRTGGASGTTGDSAGYNFFATVKNIGGTASLVSTADITAKEDQSAWDLTIDATGATIRIRVTGAASNNITWDLFLEQFGR